MTGLILDAILMLLLVAALGYGIRLERKLSALRAGQLAFAGAVTELNAAAGRAENALASLRASGEEADMLHDRIIKARALKLELEGLMARGGSSNPSVAVPSPRATSPSLRDREEIVSSPSRSDGDGDREAVEGWRKTPKASDDDTQPRPIAPSAASRALAANHAAQQSLNRARRSLDEDLFAA